MTFLRYKWRTFAFLFLALVGIRLAYMATSPLGLFGVSEPVSVPQSTTTTDVAVISAPRQEPVLDPARRAPLPVVQPIIKASSSTPRKGALPSSFTASTLAHYDGSDPTLPVLIAFQGNVYDVSPGRSYYEPGGAYHFLAGTDGTVLLEKIGGDIIKRKYTVIGTFTQQ